MQFAALRELKDTKELKQKCFVSSKGIFFVMIFCVYVCMYAHIFVPKEAPYGILYIYLLFFLYIPFKEEKLSALFSLEISTIVRLGFELGYVCLQSPWSHTVICFHCLKLIACAVRK